MSRFGFCGPSYTSESPIADCERLANMYLETIESQNGLSAGAIYYTPGLTRFCDTITDTIGRECVELNGRSFAVIGSGFYEIFSDGTFTKWGSVANDGQPASLAASETQIMLASGQHGYCFTLATNTFTVDPANLVSPVEVQYDDGFFVAIQANTNKFQYSAALDGTSWDALNVAAISVYPDNITGFIWDHRELIIFGDKHSIPYYDSGNTFTFDVVPGGFIDDGLAASFARCRADNTTFYLSKDERGNIQFKRLNGYTPVRVSNHAVETIWQGYSKVSDAAAFSFGWHGHTFIQINFPSANSNRGASWRYDIVTGMWHEVFFLKSGNEYQHLAQYHMYAFGKHLVLGPQSGIIYEMSGSVYQDDGNPIQRLRIAPPIGNEDQRIIHHSLEILAEMGLTTITDPDGTLRAPEISLQWSNDGGKTWGNEHWRDLGQVGKYKTRAIWRNLGESRKRVYKMTFSDNAPLKITDAYLDASGWGRKPTQRLATRLQQQA